MKYVCIKAHDTTDCGAASIATVAKHYGIKLPISKIREIAGTDKSGTNVYGIVHAAEQIGFTAKGVKGDKAAFFSPFPLPAIAHVIVNGNLMHYVVIHKITKKQVILADPAKGIIKCKIDEFFNMWSGVLILLVPTTKFLNSEDIKSVGFRFLELLKPQKRLLLHIFLASLLITVFGILSSFYFRFVLDDIVPNSLKSSLITISLAVIGMYLFKGILEGFRTHLMLCLSQKLDIPLILGYYQHVLKLSMNFFGSRKIGEIVSRFMDASKIRDAISNASISIMIDSLMAIAGGIILYCQNSKLFFIALLIILTYGTIVVGFNRSVKSINEKQMENSAQLNSYLYESLNGIETIKAFNAENKAQFKTDTLFVKLLRSIFKGGMISNLQQSLTNSVSTIGNTILLWVGVINVLNGEMTLGSLMTFNALLIYFLDPMKNLINLQPQMQTAIVAAERLSEIFELEPEDNNQSNSKLQPSSLNYPIKIRELNFRYGTRKPVLENINLDIKAGEKIALVGESGSGKTTLAKLLMNFYSWEKGDIYIGDYDIRDIDKRTLRSKIAYISQDIFLFSGTIYDNLRLGNEGATAEEVVEACRLSKADEFINAMPFRYATVLEENGGNLSGGQKQRLAIARALLTKPDILIMDEATSNLDSITEKAIEKTIAALSKNITTIIIAHRLSTIMCCDKIVVMDKGKFVEQGSHDELMRRKGIYYRLWKEQTPEDVSDTDSEEAEDNLSQVYSEFPMFSGNILREVNK